MIKLPLAIIYTLETNPKDSNVLKTLHCKAGDPEGVV